MATSELIDSLNRALSLELAGVIQYMQHSFLVTGAEREVFNEYFRDQSKEAHGHARMLGDKIVALGGRDSSGRRARGHAAPGPGA